MERTSSSVIRVSFTNGLLRFVPKILRFVPSLSTENGDFCATQCNSTATQSVIFIFQAENTFHILQSTSRLTFVSSDSDRDELTGVEVGDFLKYVTNFNMQLNHNVG
jgi:hypothetical protein